MSFARIKSFLGLASEDTSTAQPLLNNSDEKPTLVAHQEQQRMIRQQLENKLTDAENALKNLRIEINAIGSMRDILEHINATSLHFLGPESLETVEKEMKENPELFDGYQKFHAYFENAKNYKNTIEDYLKIETKLPELQAYYQRLKESYAEYKKYRELDKLITTYENYDNKVVNKVLEYCAAKSRMAQSRP